MSFPLRYKDPDDVVDIPVDWGIERLAEGDTVASAAFTAEAGITIVSQGFTDTTSTVRLSGGTVGQTYVIEATITTAGGEEHSQSFRVTIQEA